MMEDFVPHKWRMPHVIVSDYECLIWSKVDMNKEFLHSYHSKMAHFGYFMFQLPMFLK
jgi:hypothetical protein